jgi:hypothetical protein
LQPGEPDKCDIRTGKCACAPDELGDGCYYKAAPLPTLATADATGNLEVITYIFM